MSENLTEFIITWRIENFSFSWHKSDEAIESPEFRAYLFSSTEWRLRVFPRGRTNSDYISCLLARNWNGPKQIQLNVEISFLGTDGTALAQKCSKNETFSRNYVKGFNSFVKRYEVFVEERAKFLPGDILTVRCRLWTKDTNRQSPEKLFARTRIGVVRKLISGTVDGFSGIPANEMKSFRIASSFKEINEYRMNLQLSEGTNCDENILLEIIFPENQCKTFCTCKVYLFDAEENKLECGKSAVDFQQVQDWKFLLFPTKWKLMAKKSLYLPNDILSLECEIIISTGTSLVEFEETGDRISPELNNISIVDRFRDPPASSSALKDLGNLYKDQILCDVTLKTDTEVFPAHTVILSARSSVFRAMFTNDMKEKRNGCVHISDFGSETIRQLLLYMYTDAVGDMLWDTAFQLYEAADKYAIISLKEKCSTLLKESLCTSKACALLVLADTHQAIDLKKFVQNYICQNDDKILGSREWKDLEQKNPHLFIETLSQMYANVRAF